MSIDFEAVFQAVEAEAKAEQKERVQQSFRGRNIGGEDPQHTSIDRIFEAVRDYEKSRQWN